MSDSLDNVINTHPQAVPVVPQARRSQRHWIFILLLVGLGSTLLLTTLAGNAQTFALLLNANLLFVMCIVGVQSLRYAAMAISTRVVAQIVAVRVPFVPLFQVTVAGAAANRTFVGGAAGFVVRLAFFIKRGMHTGTFGAVEAIEDLASLVAIFLLFVSGLAIVVASGAASQFRWDVIGAFLAATLLLAAGVVAFVRRRAWVEGAADIIVRGLDRVVSPILRRKLYDAGRVSGAVADFYRALELAQRDPGRVLLSFLCSVARLGCDATALYFAFRAVGYQAPPGDVLVIFVVSSSVSTLAAVPGQIGVMETTLTLMSTAFGIPAPIAVSATLLYRLISFWLPVPFGYAFAWNLERKGMI